jgi:hypothetical protein
LRRLISPRNDAMTTPPELLSLYSTEFRMVNTR